MEIQSLRVEANIIKTIFSALLLLLLSGCDFSPTPWNLDTTECSGISTADNIRKLEKLNNLESLDSYSIGLTADSQRYPERLRDALKELKSDQKVKFIVILGDLTELGLSMEFNWICKIIKEIDKPIFTVIGNHDGLSFGKQLWSKIFGLYDYSFNFQDSKFIFYNDNKYEFQGLKLPDIDFIERESTIKDNENREHTIAFSHILPWSQKENSDEVLKFNDFLFQQNIIYNLHGHTHKEDIEVVESEIYRLYHIVVANSESDRYGKVTVFRGRDSLKVEFCQTGKSCRTVLNE